jgi:hypothetical protein
VPSVSELANVGVTFAPTAGGLSTITFDANTVTFPPPRGDPGLQHGDRAPQPGRVRRGVGPAGAGAVHGADERHRRHRRGRGRAAGARGGAEPDEERRRGGQDVERDEAVRAVHQGGVRGPGRRGGEPLLQRPVAHQDEAVHAQVRVQLLAAAHTFLAAIIMLLLTTRCRPSVPSTPPARGGSAPSPLRRGIDRVRCDRLSRSGLVWFGCNCRSTVGCDSGSFTCMYASLV